MEDNHRFVPALQLQDAIIPATKLQNRPESLGCERNLRSVRMKGRLSESGGIAGNE